LGDLNGEGRETGSVGRDGHESRGQNLFRRISDGSVRELGAWVSKRGLGHGMIFGLEHKLNSISNGSSDVGGTVGERPVGTNEDLMLNPLSADGSDGGKKESSTRESHYDN